MQTDIWVLPVTHKFNIGDFASGVIFVIIFKKCIALPTYSLIDTKDKDGQKCPVGSSWYSQDLKLVNCVLNNKGKNNRRMPDL